MAPKPQRVMLPKEKNWLMLELHRHTQTCDLALSEIPIAEGSSLDPHASSSVDAPPEFVYAIYVYPTASDEKSHIYSVQSHLEHRTKVKGCVYAHCTEAG